MAIFFYKLLVALLHSLWQSGLLFFCYYLFSFFAKKAHPINHRNLLLGVLCIQLISTITLLFFNLIFNSHLYIYFGSALSWLQQYAYWLVLIYVIIVAYKVASVSYNYKYYFKRYTHNLIMPLADYQIFTNLKAAEMGIAKAVSLWYSFGVKVPITFGFLKPIILIPAAFVNNLTTKEIESIILHELAHIKNNDYLINWFVIGMDTLYFFNPFISICVKKLCLAREKNCDLVVLQNNYDALPYAQMLLKIARYHHATKPFALAAVPNKSMLLSRIQYFTKANKVQLQRYNLLWLGILLCTIMFTAIIFINIPTTSCKASKGLYNYTAQTLIKKTAKYGTINELPLSKVKVSTSYLKPNDKPTSNSNRKNNIEKFEYAKFQIAEADAIYKQVNNINEVIDSVKEITYFEENSQGRKTKYYQLIKINNKWQLVPKLMLTEKYSDSAFYKNLPDSLHYQ